MRQHDSDKPFSKGGLDTYGIVLKKDRHFLLASESQGNPSFLVWDKHDPLSSPTPATGNLVDFETHCLGSTNHGTV